MPGVVLPSGGSSKSRSTLNNTETLNKCVGAQRDHECSAGMILESQGRLPVVT